MMHRRILLAALILLTGACREGDGPADPSAIDARIHLMSSPNGAEIFIDGRETNQTTPDTVGLRRGDRLIELVLDSGGYAYSYAALLRVERSDSVFDLMLPVGLQCLQLNGNCMGGARRHYEAGGMRFAATAIGSLFFWDGGGEGLLWPAASLDSYTSSGMPFFAGRANGREVALGIYDHAMLVGLPAPRTTRTGERFVLEQQGWILPPRDPLLNDNTVRGILLEEEVIADDGLAGVVVVRLTFRNVSDDTMVHRFAPHIDEAPVTFTDAWIGFGIDPDIGSSTDDWLSYDVDLDMVFAYDANFSEPEFSASGTSPGLLGLRVLEAPPGTTVLLNAWPIEGDWDAGTSSELAGFGMLTGSNIYEPQHAHERIGYMPPTNADIRISVTAGPLTLEPGDEATITVAIAVAPPAAGSFTSGAVMMPGDPLDTTRPLYAAAAELRTRMVAAETLIQP